jgi:hypothetical protein
VVDALQPLQVSGGGFAPGEQVRLTIGDDGQPLGAVNADAAGAIEARVVLPGSVPFGVQGIRAVGASGAKVSTAVQVYWGGWPPLGVWTVGEPGPGTGEVTFDVAGRNRSDYVLEGITVTLDFPTRARLVWSTPGGVIDEEQISWTLPGWLDRTTFGPLRATFAVDGQEPVSARTTVGFRHRRPRDCVGDGCLPAFISSTQSESPPVPVQRGAPGRAESRDRQKELEDQI